MGYDTSSSTVCCQSGVSDLSMSGFQCGIKRITPHLKKMVAPEPTDIPQPPPEPFENRIFGAAKALFWTAVSIGIGTAFAALCN